MCVSICLRASTLDQRLSEPWLMMAEDEVAYCLHCRAVSHVIQQKKVQNNDRQHTGQRCSYGTVHIRCVLSEMSTVCLCLHAHRRGK